MPPTPTPKRPELIDLAKVSARCGGIYIAHIRNESGGLIGYIQESIDIAQASGAPAEIYHFKESGRENLEAGARPGDRPDRRARASGAYASPPTCTPTPLLPPAPTPPMPAWVQDGGLEKWTPNG